MLSHAKTVAHVTTAHPVTDNRILRKECVALAEASINVVLVAPAEGNINVSGVRVIALPTREGRLKRILAGSWDAWRALAIVQPHLIHIHDPELIPIAALWRIVHRKPAIFDAHEDLAKQVLGKPYIFVPLRPLIAFLARGLERFADRTMDGVVAATPAIARNFRHSRVALVQNFPWLRDFPSPTAEPENKRARLVYVGAINEGRGGEEMIEAINTTDSDVVLDLAGPATASMINRISLEGNQRVVYLGVLLPQDIPEVVATSRAGFVVLHPLPNYMESQPTKLFEYMAAARPFIASDFPSWKELLEDFTCGIFVDPLDVADICRSIDIIVQAPDAARAMGMRGREAIERFFNFEAEKDQLLNLTRILLAKTGQ